MSETNQTYDAMSNNNYVNNHVLIIGGGQVGLSFALLLAHHGIYSTLIEQFKYPTISPDDDVARSEYLDSRNTALSRRTVQIYTEIGLWESLQSHACRIDGVEISELGSFGRAKLDKTAEGVESFGQVMENAWLGRQLLLAVQASEFITLIDGASVTDIRQDDKLAMVVFNQDGKTKALSAPLVVACDGRDSISRQILKVGADTHDYGQVGIVGVVQTDKPHGHIGIEKFSAVGPLAILPLTDGHGDGMDGTTQGYRRSVVFICKAGEEERYLNDDAYFMNTLQEVFGSDAGRFVAVGRRGAYPLSRVLAHRQVVGRCVIMGNAAHTLHPVAGQGFNLCLRDVHALANMLAHEKNRHADYDFGNYANLRAYEQARQKDQKRVIKFCDMVVGSFTHPNPVMKLMRNVGLIAFDKVPGIKPLVATYAMGLKS